MLDTNFPTIDPKNPYKLTEMEKNVIERLQSAFEQCEKLQQHMNLLLNKGSLYKVFNNNLLYLSLIHIWIGYHSVSGDRGYGPGVSDRRSAGGGQIRQADSEDAGAAEGRH